MKGTSRKSLSIKKKCMHISERPEGLGEDGPRCARTTACRSKGDALTVRIHPTGFPELGKEKELGRGKYLRQKGPRKQIKEGGETVLEELNH